VHATELSPIPAIVTSTLLEFDQIRYTGERQSWLSKSWFA